MENGRSKEENYERQECYRISSKSYEREECVHGGKERPKEEYLPADLDIWI